MTRLEPITWFRLNDLDSDDGGPPQVLLTELRNVINMADIIVFSSNELVVIHALCTE